MTETLKTQPTVEQIKAELDSGQISAWTDAHGRIFSYHPIGIWTNPHVVVSVIAPDDWSGVGYMPRDFNDTQLATAMQEALDDLDTTRGAVLRARRNA